MTANRPGSSVREKTDFIGEEAGLGQSFDIGMHGPGPGGDDCPFEPQHFAIKLDAVRGQEFRLAQKDVNPQIPETLGRVVVTDTSPQAPHTRHDRAEIGFEILGRLHPIPGCVPKRGHRSAPSG